MSTIHCLPRPTNNLVLAITYKNYLQKKYKWPFLLLRIRHGHPVRYYMAAEVCMTGVFPYSDPCVSFVIIVQKMHLFLRFWLHFFIIILSSILLPAPCLCSFFPKIELQYQSLIMKIIHHISAYLYCTALMAGRRIFSTWNFYAIRIIRAKQCLLYVQQLKKEILFWNQSLFFWLSFHRHFRLNGHFVIAANNCSVAFNELKVKGKEIV